MAVGEQGRTGTSTGSNASNVRKVIAFAGGYAICAVVAVSFSQAGHAASLVRADVAQAGLSSVGDGSAALATLAASDPTTSFGSLSGDSGMFGAPGGQPAVSDQGAVAAGTGIGRSLVRPGTGEGAPLAAVAAGPGLGATFRFADDALFSSDPGIDGTFEQVQQVVQTSDRLLVGERGVVLASGLIRPITGSVTSGYGMRFHPYLHQWRVHTGIDLGASCGTPVRAAADGTVTAAGWNTVGYGNQVVVDNGKVLSRAMSTTYNHLSAIMVNSGDVVRQGQVIGLVGTTGWSTGCHLHFEVLIDGVKVDPAPFLDLAPSVSPTLPPTRPGRDGRPTDAPTTNPTPSARPSTPTTAVKPSTPSTAPTTSPTTPPTTSTKPSNPTPTVPGTTPPVPSTPGTSTPGTSTPGTSAPGTSTTTPGTSTSTTSTPSDTSTSTTTTVTSTTTTTTTSPAGAQAVVGDAAATTTDTTTTGTTTTGTGSTSTASTTTR